jgi:magnesium transporter
MIANCLQIDEALKLTPMDPERAAEAIRRPDARVWLDLQGFEPEELDRWLAELGIEGLPRRLCIEARDRTGFYPLKEELFFVIPVLDETQTLGDVDYLACLCTENLLLTLHDRSVVNPQHQADMEVSEAWLTERSIAALVSAAMIDQSLGCLHHTVALRKAMLGLERQMDSEPDTVEAEQILDMRSDLLTLTAMVSEQLPCVQALSVTDKPFFKLQDAQGYMSCALANLQAVDSTLTWLDGLNGSLRSGFQMHAQDKTNRRLNMLTILSAIFMPITLLAGIWGMNFEVMPELKYRFAYPIALGFMALIGTGMYLFFRKGGWLD